MVKPLKIFIVLALILVLTAGSYLAYVLTTYYRIEDYQQLVP